MLSLGEIARSDAKHLDQKSTTRWHHLTNENAKYFGIENVEKKRPTVWMSQSLILVWQTKVAVIM